MLRSILGALMIGLVATPAVWAHGEHKPGPQGGYIRMPGAYHIELIPQKKGYTVRLLDLQFRQPTVQKSALRLVWQQGKTQRQLLCRAQAETFYCELPNGQQPRQGQLKVSSQRLGLKGMDVTYVLPLTHTPPS